jgi:hypothetical protein
MRIVNIGSDSKRVIDLDLSVSGRTVSIAEGTIVWDEKEHSMPAQEYEFTSLSDLRYLVGWIAQDGDGDMVLIVDEVGPGDPPLVFVGTGYTPVHRLFMANPKGESTLKETDLQVFKLIDRNAS